MVELAGEAQDEGTRWVVEPQKPEAVAYELGRAHRQRRQAAAPESNGS